MKHVLTPILMAALLCCVAGDSLRAQVVAGTRRAGFNPRAGVGFGYPGVGIGFSGNFASTAAEGRARGYADVIRSTGSYNRDTAEAMKNYEDARSKYLDNKRKWQELYWDRKERGEQERDKRYAKERERREKYLASRDRTAGTNDTPRLTPSQLDPSTGKITWPEALSGDDYAAEREQIEELFVLRAHTQTSLGSFDMAGDVKQACDSMLAKLKGNIKSLTPNSYIAGRKFIDSVAAEAAHAAD